MLGTMQEQERPATVADVHALALAMPHVTIVARLPGQAGLPGGRQVLHLLPQPAPRRDRPGDRRALRRRHRLLGRIEADKQSLIDDPAPRSSRPSTSTATRRSCSAPRDLPAPHPRELAEVIQDAWLSRASARRATDWLRASAAARHGECRRSPIESQITVGPR